MQLCDRADIDDQRWNEAVKNSPYFRHYALTYFLDATAPRWKGLVEGDYDWVWPIPFKIFPALQVYQPLLAQQLGPFGTAPVSHEALEQGWELLSRQFRKVSVKFADVYTSLPWPATPHRNIELDLRSTSAQLYRGYNRNATSNIKRAEKAGLETGPGPGGAEGAIRMFRAHRGRDLQILNEAFYRHVQSIYEAFAERGEAETWNAHLRGEPLACVLLLKTNGRLLNFFTASSPAGREHGAMHALFHAIISRYAGAASALDFEGSNDPNLAFFYQSFGGSERVYLQSERRRFPFLKSIET